jgi:predicted aconitase
VIVKKTGKSTDETAMKENIEKIHTFAMRHSMNTKQELKQKITAEGKPILSEEDLRKIEERLKEKEEQPNVQDPLKEIYKKSYYIEDEPESL